MNVHDQITPKMDTQLDFLSPIDTLKSLHKFLLTNHNYCFLNTQDLHKVQIPSEIRQGEQLPHVQEPREAPASRRWLCLSGAIAIRCCESWRYKASKPRDINLTTTAHLEDTSYQSPQLQLISHTESTNTFMTNQTKPNASPYSPV